MSASRVIIVGADPALLGELTPSLRGRGFDVSPLVLAREALAVKDEAFGAIIADEAHVAAPELSQLAALCREKNAGFIIVKTPSQLNPAQHASLRHLTWPLPARFLDQVRSADVPIAFLVEPTLFLTRGFQNALAQAGVAFIQLESSVGLVTVMTEQAQLYETRRTMTPRAKASGLWRWLAGEPAPKSAQEPLGKVVVASFPGSWEEASQIDVRLRQTLADASCYHVVSADVATSAALALGAGQPALLPREDALRIAEILSNKTNLAAAPRQAERVLLFDNETATLARLADTLLAIGYEVVTTSDGAQALRLMREKPFQLAAIGGSAFETNRLSGAKLALALRELDADICLILMIDQHPAQEALKGVSRAVELNINDAILKPIDSARLALSIKRALESRFLRLDNIRLRKEAERSAESLAQINGFQTKFFAMVAHDVKNPLTAILGYAEVLAARLKEPTELKCATYIHSAAKALNLLISDLVDLAAIESGKLRVEMGALDLAAVIANLQSRVEVVAAAKKINFQTQVPPGIPALRGDPNRIGQVLQNLCTNAVQYTPDGGKVTVEVKVASGWVTVGVRDTGIGISKEDLPRIWERFFQAKQAQTMRKAGFGLGLKIAREIVQMHGGDMGIESEQGVGSFFYFKLPIPGAQPASAR